MARRLDLGDRVEPGRPERVAIRPCLGHLRVGGDDIDAVIGQPVGQGEQSPDRRLAVVVGIDHRPARDVGAGATDEGERPLEHEGGMVVVEDHVGRAPAEAGALFRPGPRLVDVAARDVDRPSVPVGELLGRRLARPGRVGRPVTPRRRTTRRCLPRSGRGGDGRSTRVPGRRPRRRSGRAGRGRDPTRRCSGPPGHRSRS